MSETITTKPFVSRAQAGWAFSSGQPFARRWAKQTGPYKRLPYKVRKKALAELATTKDYARAGEIAEALALKGESLAPGVTRIHGDLCNVHGRWGSCRAAGYGGAGPSGSKRVAPKTLPKAPTPKKGGGGKKAGGKKGGAARKPIKSDAQKRAEHEAKRTAAQQAKIAEQQANRSKVLEGLGIDAAGQDALKALQDGAQPDAAAVKRAGLIEAGLAEQAKDGSYRLTASGRAMLAAADAGDAGRAGSTISAARDRTTARTERQTAAQQRQAAAAARRAAAQQRQPRGAKPKQTEPKPKPAPKLPGGGGGSAPKPVVGGGGGARSQPQASIPAALISAVQDLSNGKTIDQATIDALVRNGLARLDKDGKPFLTGQGLRVLSKGKAAYSSGSKSFGGDTSSTEPPVRSTTVNHLPQPKHLTWPIKGKRTTIDALQAGQSVRAVRSGSDRMSTLSTNSAVNSIAQKAGSPGDYLVVEDPQKPSTYHLQVKRNGTPDHGLMGGAWAALHSGYRGNVYQGPNKAEALAKLKKLYASEGMPVPGEKSAHEASQPHQRDDRSADQHIRQHDEQIRMAAHENLHIPSIAQPLVVFKDATGADRWLARTTTAFEDRDGEIISAQALGDSADSPDARGPLRWWHAGRPNPLDPEQPWGPGVDLGWCDFAALHGRTLIESGTFKSAAIARAVAAKADDLELSPGFFHAAAEPDAAGVFHHIRIFERSLVPTWAGRASNYYTGLKVQGGSMDPKKIEALQTLGLPEATIKELIGDTEQAEKSADAEGVRYKESRPVVDFFRQFFAAEQPTTKAAEPPVEPVAPADAFVPGTDVLAALKAQIEALTAEVATLKAAPVEAKAGMGDMGMMGGDAETPMEDTAEGGMEEPGEDAGGLTLSPEDLSAIGQAVGAALEPLISALGITQKIDGHMSELKTMLGGFVKQKDDEGAQRVNEIAALKASIDQQQAKLAELMGDQPRAGYRPTQATDNIPGQVLAAMKDQAPGGNGFDDLTAKLFPGMLPG